jgi:cytochrome c-type protein NapC
MRTFKPVTVTMAIAVALLAMSGLAQAAPDWNDVPRKTIMVFYPGTASIEWAFGSPEHGGKRAIRKGETCAGCHTGEAVVMGNKMVTGKRLEPNAAAVKGKAGSIPVTVQAAYDATNLYLRFEWWQPPSAKGKRMDEKNAVKLTVMLDDHKVEYGALGGCWASCHNDLRSMPDVDVNSPKHPRAKELDIRPDGPTKYLKESRTSLEMKNKPWGGWDKVKTEPEYTQLLKEGKFFEMWQFRSSEPPRAGYVLESRRLQAAPGLAEGKYDGGAWTVTFTRPLAGGVGIHAIVPGKNYPIGFAIHDDYTNLRYHLVSLGTTLALGDPKAGINAVKQ